MEAAHLLQAADIAHRNALPGLEFRPLELTGINAGHVVGHGFAHGFFHRHNTNARCGLVVLCRKSLTIFLKLAPRQHIGGFALAPTAHGAVFHRIGLAAHRAAQNARHVLVAHKPPLDRDGLHLADAVARGFNF